MAVKCPRRRRQPPSLEIGSAQAGVKQRNRPINLLLRPRRRRVAMEAGLGRLLCQSPQYQDRHRRYLKAQVRSLAWPRRRRQKHAELWREEARRALAQMEVVSVRVQRGARWGL